MPAETVDEPTLRTTRSTIRRKADRARYERDVVDAVLDAGLVAHVGFVNEHGVCVLPMAYARIDDALYLHGAVANAMLRGLASGIDVCVTVTLVDGLVLSRSAFHHSMNYRSVVVFGRATTVEDRDERLAALRAIVDHNLPGRSDECRAPTDSELRATRVIRLPITEASAKVRTGMPVDDDRDLELDYWAGVVPLQTIFGAAEPDGFVRAGATPPRY